MFDKSRFLIFLIIISLSIFNNIKSSSGQIHSFYKNQHKNARIVIIGAGASGIAAASKLYNHGFDNVIILEAENRIGGRIFTSKLGNYLIDLGAQWVHGEKGNVVFDIAYPMGLLDNSTVQPNPLKKSSIETDFFDSVGNNLNSNWLEKIFSDEDDGIYGNINDFESIGEYKNNIFLKKSINNLDILKKKSKYLHALELVTLTEFSAASWFEVSTSINEFQQYEGSQKVNWKKRGYSTILDVLTKRFPDPKQELPVIKNTIFNTEVVSIHYTNTNNSKDVHPVIVTSSKNQTFIADHVIATVSLGVLKEKYESLFIPSLPKSKISAIKNLGYGSITKIYLLFEKPFWKENDNIEDLMTFFLWDEAEKNELEADPKRRWLLGMIGALTVEHRPNILTCWVTGKYAKIVDTVPDAQVLKYTVESIQRFLGKKFNVTNPISMSRSQWSSNPHFRGTYSFWSVAAETQNVHREFLESPLGNSVFFAGEATSKDRFSTVDGAIKSGWAAAERLISLYKENQ